MNRELVELYEGCIGVFVGDVNNRDKWSYRTRVADL